MAMIKIDGIDYDTDDLSEEARAHILSLQFVNAELERLKLKQAAMQTARNAYAKSVKQHLEISDDDEIEIDGLGDTISFD